MSMYGYSATDTDRRLANVIQIGRVSAVDVKAGLAQVDLDGPSTDWIPWATSRAGNDRTWWAPEFGEQVVVAAPSGELSSAVIIGCLYQDAYPEPADNADVHRTVYQDGTVVEYDRAAHQYKIDVSASSGRVVVICKTATVQASESVTMDTPQTNLTGNLSVAGVMNVDGNGSGGGATSTINGSVRVLNGDVRADEISLKGHGHIEQGDGARTGNSVV